VLAGVRSQAVGWGRRRSGPAPSVSGVGLASPGSMKTATGATSLPNPPRTAGGIGSVRRPDLGVRWWRRLPQHRLERPSATENLDPPEVHAGYGSEKPISPR
jgi:hypothetical protein